MNASASIPKKFKPGQEWRTRDGRVAVISGFNPGDHGTYVVRATLEGCEGPRYYNSHGHWINGTHPQGEDLIELAAGGQPGDVPPPGPKQLAWQNGIQQALLAVAKDAGAHGITLFCVAVLDDLVDNEGNQRQARGALLHGKVGLKDAVGLAMLGISPDDMEAAQAKQDAAYGTTE